MKLVFKPNSNLGKYCVSLIVIVPILLFIGMYSVKFYDVPAGKTILQDIIVRPGIALPMLLGFISGIAAFFTGIIAILRKKDYSVFVFISTIIGFMVLIWCLTQLL